MTREEAIQKLKEVEGNNLVDTGEDLEVYDELLSVALDMAIEALTYQNLSKPNNTCEVDLISRQKLIDAHYEWCNKHPNHSFPTWSLRLMKDAPSAEAVQGEWIDIDNYYRLATCSLCHKVTMFEKWGEYTKPYNFCPNCGADMRQGEDNEGNTQ